MTHSVDIKMADNTEESKPNEELATPILEQAVLAADSTITTDSPVNSDDVSPPSPLVRGLRRPSSSPPDTAPSHLPYRHPRSTSMTGTRPVAPACLFDTPVVHTTPRSRARSMNLGLGHPHRTWWTVNSSTVRPSSPLSPCAPSTPRSPSVTVMPTYFEADHHASPESTGTDALETVDVSPLLAPIDASKLNHLPVKICSSASSRRPSLTRSSSLRSEMSIPSDDLPSSLCLPRGASPTVAETGLRLPSAPEPASGQLERRERRGSEDVIRLDSFGGEGLQRKPSGRE